MFTQTYLIIPEGLPDVELITIFTLQFINSWIFIYYRFILWKISVLHQFHSWSAVLESLENIQLPPVYSFQNVFQTYLLDIRVRSLCLADFSYRTASPIGARLGFLSVQTALLASRSHHLISFSYTLCAVPQLCLTLLKGIENHRMFLPFMVFFFLFLVLFVVSIF